MCMEACWQAVCCIATLAEEYRRGLSGAACMPNLSLKDPLFFFYSRFIATLAFRALTMSPAMRRAGGVVGISVRRDEVSPPSSCSSSSSSKSIWHCAHKHPAHFSTDSFWLLYTHQVVLTAFSTDMYKRDSCSGQISANTSFMCR